MNTTLFARSESGLVRLIGFIYLTIIFGAYYVETQSYLGSKFSTKIDMVAISIFIYLISSFLLDLVMTPRIGCVFYRTLLTFDAVFCGFIIHYLNEQELLIFMLLIIQSYIFISAGALRSWFVYMTLSLFVSMMSGLFDYIPVQTKDSLMMQWAGGLYTMIFIVIVSLQKHLDTEKLELIREDLIKKGQEQQRLSRILANHLSPQIVEMYEKNDVGLSSLKRKKITVCFIDIVGFSTLSETREPEAISAMLNDFFSSMSSIAVNNGGTVDKYIGDGMMVFFGDPSSLGEIADAKACMTMCIKMQSAMSDLNTKWMSNGLHAPIQIRIGVNSGYCNVGNIGSSTRMEYTVIGRMVNTAARIESIARPGAILVSEDTFGLIRDSFSAKSMGTKKLKGMTREVGVYELKAPKKTKVSRTIHIKGSSITVSGSSQDDINEILLKFKGKEVDQI
ncbi:adenylate/guanylate cyclase domain-containing protein [Vibrio splendidus]|nr:adenylate/guanylate cyclase domain-containing protein [Vibrio splendidus]MCC4880397.1 adenylate/guanylate cyclase domain-containing protein [Vibrio splendidus]